MWDLDEDSFITLTDENGNEVDFLLLDVMEYEGSDYMVLMPLTDEDGEEDEEELFFLKAERTEEGEVYSSIEDEALLEQIDKYSGSLYIPRITDSSETVQSNPEDPTFTVSSEDDLMQVLADSYSNIWTTVNIRYENDYLSDHTDQEKTELLYQLQNRVRRADPLNASNMLSLKLSENVLFIAYYCSADMLKKIFYP